MQLKTVEASERGIENRIEEENRGNKRENDGRESQQIKKSHMDNFNFGVSPGHILR